MHIAFFINALYNSGGTERVSTVIANELAKDKANHIFMISRVKSELFFPLSPEVTYLYLSEEQESHYLHYLKYVYKISRLIKRYKIEKWIDVCSAMSLMSIPAKLFTGIDIYTWEHFNYTVEWNPVTNKIARYLACKYAKKVIVLTKSDQKLFKEKYKTDNVICIPNPITATTTGRVDVAHNRTIISIGRLTFQKGYDLLLHIWKLTNARKNGWKLIIVGDGEKRMELEQEIDYLNIGDTVELLNPTKNVEFIYQQAAFFIMSSRFEGLPLVLIEAVSMGLPIISFDCETGPREVVDNGRNGFLVNCFDKQSFAEMIDLLSQDEAKRVAFSQESIRKSFQFDIGQILPEWYSMLRS